MTDWSAHYAQRAARMTGSDVSELLALLARPDVISFAGGVPDPALFPTEAIRLAYDAILSEPKAAAKALQYSTPQGDPNLRAWIAEDMRRRGVRCAAENVLIVNGAQQALDFIGKLFLSAGDVALTSRPTFLGALQAFDCYEPRYDELPSPGSNRGAGDFPAEAPNKPKFGYVMPEFENPTGRTLNQAERERLLDFADALGIPLIEDSPYETLRYEGTSPPALLALAAERAGGVDRGRVIYLGSFSKSISPSLRIGWLVGPAEVVARLALVKQASDIQVSTINQKVIARVAPEIVPVQTEKVRPIYRARRNAMLRAMRTHMPDGVSWSEPEGGFFVWVTLPERLDAKVLLSRAVARVKTAFVPGTAFFPDRSGPNTLRLSFSLGEPAVIEEGIGRLARVVREAA
jgi:DNA-binding transcriptional MocR family regulator